MMRSRGIIVGLACALATVLAVAGMAFAQDDARTKQLRLLCAQLSGDLTEPGGLAAFKRCLTQDPIAATKQNVFGTPAAVQPPAGHGRNTRSAVASAVYRFQVAGSTSVYVLASDAKLWRATLDGKDAKVVDPAVTSFYALDGTSFYALDPQGNLWREDGDGARQKVDATVARFQPLDGTTVYVLGTDGRLWRETGDQSNRSLVDAEVAAFRAVDATIVYVKGREGKLWRENGSNVDRRQVGSNVGDFRIVGSSVYLTGSDGGLWRKN